MPRFRIRDFSESLLFDGANSTVVIPHNANQLLTSGFTLSAWINPRSLGENGNGHIISKSTGAAGQGGFAFRVRSVDKLALIVNNGTDVSPPSGTLVFNTWQHALVTVDSSAVVTFYINGVQTGTPAATAPLSGITTTNSLVIGNRSGTTDRTFDGGIDEVRIWNRVLTAQEITDLHFSGLVAQSGLISQYLLNEGYGTVAIDTSPSANNGAISNAVYSGNVPMTSRFLIRNENASILANGANGSAGNIISVPFSASLNPTSAVTAEVWFRPTGALNGCLFDNSTVGVTNSYTVYLSADGGLLWFSTIGGLSKTVLTTTAKAKNNEWNFASCTYDGANILLFLNGALVGSTAATGALGVNTNALYIGAIYSGAGSFTFNGRLARPRVYAAGCTLAEHQDRFYRGITSANLQAALKLDLDTGIGAGTAITDLSGTGNNATLGAGGSWTSDSPYKSRKRSINANMVKNGDFEYAPPFTAATNASLRWIDGTAAGSATNDLFNWWMTLNGTGTVGNISFDSSVFRSGLNSLKLVATTGSTGAANPGLSASLGVAIGPTQDIQRRYFTPVSPNTTYTFSCYVMTNAISANGAGARLRVVEYDGVNTGSTGVSNSAYVTGTNSWAINQVSFTTSSTTRYVNLLAQIDTSNLTTGSAWFDDLSLTPVYPEGRVPANGNLVKNFDFEVAPPFVAATNTASRFIDGTAAGSATNSTYKYAVPAGSIGGGGTTNFDSTVFRNGAFSLKLSTNGVGGSISVTQYVTLAEGIALGTIYRLLPSTSYTLTGWVKTSNAAVGSVTLSCRELNAATSTVATNTSSSVDGTADWTQVTVTFTTAASTVYGALIFRNNVTGNISDAWFDDIYLAKTTNPGRVIIT